MPAFPWYTIVFSPSVPPSIAGTQLTEHTPVIRSKSVTLTCIVEGTPEPQLTWLKDETTIVLSENPHIRILSDGQALQINNARLENTGLYMCHAENEAGIAAKSYDVEVQGKHFKILEYSVAITFSVSAPRQLSYKELILKETYDWTPTHWGPKEIDGLLVFPSKASTLLTGRLLVNRSGQNLPRKSGSSQTIHTYKPYLMVEWLYLKHFLDVMTSLFWVQVP